jgi:lysophospholipase L1-like esterase
MQTRRASFLDRVLVVSSLSLVAALQIEAATPPKDTSAAPKSSPARKRYQAGSTKQRVPKAPKISTATRQEANEGVLQKVANGAGIPVENPAALIPFFEQLYRNQRGEIPGPLHVLQYGDSHTAADEWTGDLRQRFQEKFGDGGGGYIYAGHPYNGYRNLTAKTGSTRGWKPEGVVGKPGDGVLGLGGISMSATKPHESVFLLTEGQTFELFYLRQPGGGSFEIFDNGESVETISTEGELSPAYYRYETDPGQHRLEVETRDRGPVRLFGWSADKATGVTYEPLGINGASATMILDWDEAVLDSNIGRRSPGLVVLAYGTNESGRKDWTLETYRRTYEQILMRIRNAAPTATILVVGPPDRYIRTRTGWVTLDQVDTIVEAQRQAALAQGCAFWDLRAKMGGKGSMRQWVLAGMAQYDFVHFTAPGYRMIGDAVFRDLMSQYDLFLRVREPLTASNPQGTSVVETPR